MDAGRSPRTLDPWVRRLLDESPNAVAGIDDQGVIDYANPQAGALLGYPPEDLLGSLLTDHISGWDPTGPDVPVGRTVRGRLVNGRTIPLKLGVTYLDDVDGSTWTLVTVHDESARVAAERGLTDAERRLAAMAALNEAVVRAPDEQTLYADLCRISVDIGGWFAAWVGGLGPGNRVEALASAGEFDAFIRYLGLAVAPESPELNGPAITALLAGEPLFIDDYATDPRLGPDRQRGLDLGVRALVSLPLLCEGRVAAVAVLYSTRREVFTPARRTQLSGLAFNVSVGLDAFASARRLDEAMRVREQLHQRLVLAQEAERERIAADVHDESIQSLAAVDLRLSVLKRRWEALDPELAASVDAISDLVHHVTDGLRSLLFELETPRAGTSLVELVTDTVAHTFEHVPVAWSVDGGDGEDAVDCRLSETVHVQLVRILKEALANVRRHAAAHEVRVVLRLREGGLEVAVTDDGRGLQHGSDAPRPGHRGLTTMRDRAAIVGGWLRIEPERPGTTVRFWVPVEPTPASASPRLAPLH